MDENQNHQDLLVIDKNYVLFLRDQLLKYASDATADDVPHLSKDEVITLAAKAAVLLINVRDFEVANDELVNDQLVNKTPLEVIRLALTTLVECSDEELLALMQGLTLQARLMVTQHSVQLISH